MEAICALCNEVHATYARTMTDGSTHVLVTASDLARRISAAHVVNERIATAHAAIQSPFTRRALQAQLPAKDLGR